MFDSEEDDTIDISEIVCEALVSIAYYLLLLLLLLANWLEVADVIQCSGTCRKLWSRAPLTLPGPSRSCRAKASDNISFKYSFNRFIGHLSLF